MKKRILIVVIALLIIVSIAIAFGVFDKNKNENGKAQSQLTGLDVDEELADRPILAVMIENSQEARPQTGLDSAGIVFESVTEGGITRYLAMYQEKMPEDIGPVRSLRSHFLDWAMGFDASIAHVGGSAQALQEAEDRNAKSLSQFKFSEPYYRDESRSAPHNLYAKTAGLREIQKDESHKKSQFDNIPRSNDAPAADPQAIDIILNFSSALFKVEFKYDKTTNSYDRYLAGEPHLDKETDQVIKVKNLIVLELPKNRGQQDGADGSGTALVFKDGQAIKGRWNLDSYRDRVKVVDDTGNEIPLNRGDSWFAGLPNGRSAEY